MPDTFKKAAAQAEQDRIKLVSRPYLTIGMVAQLIGVSPFTVSRWVKSDRFIQPCGWIGASRVWSTPQVLNWIEEQLASGAPTACS
jgi:predicted DNA-binding transcriptional regulator AlpA